MSWPTVLYHTVGILNQIELQCISFWLQSTQFGADMYCNVLHCNVMYCHVMYCHVMYCTALGIYSQGSIETSVEGFSNTSCRASSITSVEGFQCSTETSHWASSEQQGHLVENNQRHQWRVSKVHQRYIVVSHQEEFQELHPFEGASWA